MEQERLFQLLAKSLAYSDVVYRQSLYITNQGAFDNNFVLEYKFDYIPGDSLLFFVPAISSNGGNAKLTVKVPTYNKQQKTTVYIPNIFDIVVESNNGRIRPAGVGDIITNRMCIFRFNIASKQAILVNSPLYNDASFSKLTATDAEFLNVPRVTNPNVLGGVDELATKSELAELREEINKVRDRIIFGIEDPEDALANAPEGTIYIQVEED